jgi:RNA polymerase sigma-70 factor (ECF subfamily)
MSDDNEFLALMARVRAGEAGAAQELLRQTEDLLRVEVRLRLRDPRLRRLIDEADVCQSVMCSFFVRARLGQYDVAGPKDLMRLLSRMARNKVATQARHHTAECRDVRRAAGLDGAEAPAAGASPSQAVANEELLRELRARLSEEERRIADLRAAGRSWAEVAAEMGGSGDARRVQLQRAADRVGRELGLECDDE